ncbi:MAG: ABC transporter permease [Verrucomicrobiales bacterium]|nr:ABC transporter permease [Verrucomicrobiales bacterium]
MNWSQKLQRWCRALFRKRELDAQMDDELRSHIEMQTQDNIASGMNPAEARWEALRQFGRMELIKETCREERGFTWVENLSQDFRFGVRMLRKNPGFTVTALLTLALGIGATTIVFSIVNAVLLRPLDYPGSERIVNVWEGDLRKGFESSTYNYYTSPATFVDWRRDNQVFEAIAFAAHHDGWLTLSFILSGDGLAERLSGRFVSANYFKVFGLEPILGRSFLPEEEVRGSRRVVVISHRLWQRLYNGDPGIVGKTIALENRGRHTYEIIGVMPEGFRFPWADVWVSCAHMPRPMALRTGRGMHVVARLKPGVSLAHAETEMNVIQSRIHKEYGHLAQQGQNAAIGPHIRLQPLLDSTVGGVRSSLMVFLGSVGLVLLIACANVANLQLSRALSRQREIAVRAALGASRWRIMCQLLCEGIVLSLLGAVAGTLLAHWGTKLVVQFSAGTIPRIETVGIDVRVFFFAVVASLVTGILFGLAPAWQSSRTDFNESLKEGSQRVSSGLAHFRLRSAFTVTQVALALVLLIGAGLLIRSFHRLQNVETGFDTDELLTVEISMIGAAYENAEQRSVFLRRLIDEIKAAPGVEAAAAVGIIPDRPAWPHGYARSDRPLPPEPERERAGVRVTTPGFLKTFGIPLLRGREFTESDTLQSEKVVLINQAFADKIFPGEDPLGKQIHCEGQSRQIIGVFGNVKNTGLAGSVAFARILKTQLFGIGALDPTTFLGVSVLLTCVALAACLIPALRAMRVNPMEALRHD